MLNHLFPLFLADHDHRAVAGHEEIPPLEKRYTRYDLVVDDLTCACKCGGLVYGYICIDRDQTAVRLFHFDTHVNIHPRVEVAHHATIFVRLEVHLRTKHPCLLLRGQFIGCCGGVEVLGLRIQRNRLRLQQRLALFCLARRQPRREELVHRGRRRFLARDIRQVRVRFDGSVARVHIHAIDENVCDIALLLLGRFGVQPCRFRSCLKSSSPL